MSDGYVYFIGRADDEGPIKIGFSVQPEFRLTRLDAASAYPLKLLGTIPGPLRLERQFHNLFRDYHVRREWFARTPSLLVAIEAVVADRFDVAALPEARGLPGQVRRKLSPDELRLYRETRQKTKAREEAMFERIRIQSARRYQPRATPEPVTASG